MNNKSNDNEQSVPVPSTFLQLILSFFWPMDTVKKKIAVAIVVVLFMVIIIIKIFIWPVNREISEKPTLPSNSSIKAPIKGTIEIEKGKEQSLRESKSASETNVKEVRQWPNENYNK